MLLSADCHDLLRRLYGSYCFTASWRVPICHIWFESFLMIPKCGFIFGGGRLGFECSIELDYFFSTSVQNESVYNSPLTWLLRLCSLWECIIQSSHTVAQEGVVLPELRCWVGTTPNYMSQYDMSCTLLSPPLAIQDLISSLQLPLSPSHQVPGITWIINKADGYLLQPHLLHSVDSYMSARPSTDWLFSNTKGHLSSKLFLQRVVGKWSCQRKSQRLEQLQCLKGIPNGTWTQIFGLVYFTLPRYSEKLVAAC